MDMKTRIDVRTDKALKRAIRSAALFNKESLSDFIHAACIARVNAARLAGLTIKEPAMPVDRRRAS